MDLNILLRKTHLCTALDEQDLKRLLPMVRFRKVKKGETLFLEGEPAEGFYLLLEGCVRILKFSPDGREYLLHRIRPGEMFAEAALFGDGRYPAHGVAEAASVVAFLPREPFFHLLRESPALSLKMMAGLAAFVREFTHKLEGLSLQDAATRLATFLLKERKRRGRDAFRLDLTRSALAAQLGVAPETLSRNLARLKEMGIIDTSGKAITIHDPVRLARLVEGEKP